MTVTAIIGLFGPANIADLVGSLEQDCLNEGDAKPSSIFSGEANVAENATSKIRRRRLRVLVVDDEDRFRQSVVYKLQSVYHATVEQAGDAPSAIKKVTEERSFDLILLDIAMPRISGSEIYKVLLAKGVVARIVFMSANRENRVKVQALDVPFLDKPLNDDLLEKILLSCAGGSTS